MGKGLLKSSSENELAGQIRDAIGAGPDEVVEIVTPQFTRTQGMPDPSSPPSTQEAWNDLRSMSYNALREMGLQPWDEPDSDGQVLMLFPGEWYKHIPRGYEIHDISGNSESFAPGETDDDIRFGCLAYGVLVKKA